MKEELVRDIIMKVIEELKTGNSIPKEKSIPVEVSARHVHLSIEDIERLFGKDYKLTRKKDLSQPEQYQCNEKVTLVGAKGAIHGVSILGPVRNHTQVEISKTDARILGISPPVRESGDLACSGDIYIATEKAVIEAKASAIIAKRHIHMEPEDAEFYKVLDKQIVKVRVNGERPLIFDDVVVRVSSSYKLSMHLDTDEANAAGCIKDTVAEIIPEKAGWELREKLEPKHNDNNPKIVTIKNKVIAERNVYEVFMQGCNSISIDKKSIITPLASDYIKQNNINVLRT